MLLGNYSDVGRVGKGALVETVHTRSSRRRDKCYIVYLENFASGPNLGKLGPPFSPEIYITQLVCVTALDSLDSSNSSSSKHLLERDK